MTNDKREIVVPENLSGKRLDTIVHELLTEFSRSKIQQWINDGHVKVDGQVLLSKKKLYGGECIEISIQPDLALTSFEPEDIEPSTRTRRTRSSRWKGEMPWDANG